MEYYVDDLKTNLSLRPGLDSNEVQNLDKALIVSSSDREFAKVLCLNYISVALGADLESQVKLTVSKSKPIRKPPTLSVKRKIKREKYARF